ncbi:MAG: efflux RND transporter permease subunit [Myxococcota bacterium]
MNRIIVWFVDNPVTANLLMCVLVVGGLMALPGIRQEEFPSIDMQVIRIGVAYLGAAPEEVAEGVCVRIEEAIEGAENIERIFSTAVEGQCGVMVELITGSDTNAALDEIKNRIDGITTFPEETEKPVISRLIMMSDVLKLAISGDADERTLKVLGQQVRDELAALDGISQVQLSYTRPYEISIEVSEETLRRHGLSLDEVARAVRRSSLDMPGGSIKAVGGEILLRSKGQAYRGGEFEDVVVLTRADGTNVTLGEIAQVRDGFRDDDLRASFNGEPAVMIKVLRAGDEDALDIAAKVKAYAARAQAGMPEGITLTIWQDEAANLRARIDALLGSAQSGLILVLLILTLFLRFRLAVWVAAGVPIAFLGALMMFPALDLTISTLAVMAFILVLGIVVDDAIVVGESVYTHERRHEDQRQAAISGTQEVYIPVIFGVLTTVAAFLPLLMNPSRMGPFFAVIGGVVIICLLFSLVESQLILPAHLAHRRTRARSGYSNPAVRQWTRFQDRMANGLEHFARDVYRPFLKRVLEWRYLTVAIGIGVLVLTASLFASGRMAFQFMPPMEGDKIYASLTMPRGTPVEQTEEAVRQLEQSANELRAELDASRGPDEPSTVRHVLSSVGAQLARGGHGRPRGVGGGAYQAEVMVELIPADDRDFGTNHAIQRWRQLTRIIPDAVELTFTPGNQWSSGEAINVQLRGSDIEELKLAAAELREELAFYQGVTDIADSFRAGKQEVKLTILPEARHLGLTQDDLARQVRQAFYGQQVQRIQRGRDDVRVMVRYPQAERRSLGDLEDMRIRTADGTEVPFASVARAELGRGYATIRRTDRQQVVNVRADIDRTVTSPEEVMAGIQNVGLPRILAAHPSVSFELEGEMQERTKALGGLARGFGLALLIIYGLLAVPLRSYIQPLIIMAVIPFGAVGAIIGHLIMGWDLVFFSMLGMVALSGVVVNASLVLVHYVNRRRDEGLDFDEAVMNAGVARFRPILLTSVTTFGGLAPLMFLGNNAAFFMIPMAISLAFGVLFATVITLLLVPCAYLIIEDIQALRVPKPAHVEPEPVMAAGP